MHKCNIRFVLLFLLGGICALSAFADERYALLIANQNYPESVGPLTNPFNDIALLEKTLEILNFHVVIVKDAKFADLARSVQKHIAKVRSADGNAISLVYYSGHGAADARTQINYLIPVDVPDAEDASLWQNSVQLKADLLDKLLSEAPNASHFVIFDACRTELRLTVNSNKVFDVDRKSFVPVTVAGGLVAYSTAERRTASDKGERSGPYARALAEELLVSGVEAVGVFRNVQLRMKQVNGQDPYVAFSGIPRIYLAGSHARESGVNLLNISAANPETAESVAFERERASARSALRGLIRQIGEEGVSAAGVFVTKSAWPNGSKIKMCFLDGPQERRAYVARIAREWTIYGNIDFDFGDLGNPRLCAPKSSLPVRITFNGPGNWSYIGMSSKKLEWGATLSLQSVGMAAADHFSKGDVDRDILHEFGHLLGFTHGWLSPSTGCNDEMDWTYIYGYMANNGGWDKATVDANLRMVDTKNNVATFGFDKKSVMNYSFPEKFFKGGSNSKCYADPLRELSLKDKLGVYKAYP